ncbi:LPXTG-site transpeptidase (sortase) family protein [Amycolatopsis pretoriensis]|uniref:LPXTG-site transpeptidase (Sortase) family protein n=1 Tax=Amycolatopsis pretoriensis TaxID=218821 RepID=A0A1H5QCC2_9PSEU|nr:class F sortase [Amycolatopsis pretoriensis]SEF23706.1 LPXTG-site transpeptidase (sortase) family protein [Amycolatopsis pretoriensis]
MLRRALLIAVSAVLLAGCGATATPAAAPPPAPAAANLTRSLPTALDVPAIDAKSTLVSLGLNADRTVEVPPVDQPLQAGWYEYGPTPGEVGPAVILGHIDGDHRKGIFWRLHELKPGDPVHVDRADGGQLTFEVTKVDQIAKKEFPTEAVYGNTTDPELRLITCGGKYDAANRNYLDNVIVYAKLKR